MTDRPEIPKRLASKIRAEQARLTETLDQIAASDFNARQHQARLAEFDADPAAFANNHYPRHAVDSYPVQTNISRCREKVAYHASRQEVRQQRVQDRLRELKEVEEAVLAEVSSMRPTSGRVPWPAPLPSVEQIMADHRADDELMLEEARRENEIRNAEIEETFRREEEELRLQQELDDEATRAMLREMTPDQQSEWRAAMKAIAEAIRDKRVGLHNINEFVRSGEWRKK